MVVDDVVRLLAPTAFEKGLEIAAFVAPCVPASLTGDSHRLGQILNNLIGNAIKFTRKGSVVVRVWPYSLDGQEAVRFDVVDEGIGIPPEQAHVLFQRFSQVDASTTRRYGGTGLGLALCRELVGLLGGKTWFASEPQAGSTFSFALPSSDAERESAVRAAQQATADGTEVLFVSDNSVLGGVVSEYVDANGGRATVIANGPDVVEALRKSSDALVIVDANLPSATLREIEREYANRGGVGGDGVLVLERNGHEARSGQATLLRPFVCATFEIVRRRMMSRVDEKRSSATDSGSGLHILVAEDNPTNQMLMTALLHSFGHRCTVVCDGREALERCAGETFDVIVMDMNMPVMDGVEATMRLRGRESSRTLPIIGLTAAVWHEDVERCRAAGMTGVLSKPVDWDHLRDVLASKYRPWSGSMKVAS